MVFVGDFQLQPDGKYKVGFIHYYPLDPLYGMQKTKEELEQTGFFIDSLPEPEVIEGKIPVLYADPENKRVYYEYVDRPLSLEEMIKGQIEYLKQLNADLTYQLMMKGVL